jgi:hypothetical protein
VGLYRWATNGRQTSSRRTFGPGLLPNFQYKIVEGPVGFEPTTPGLKVRKVSSLAVHSRLCRIDCPWPIAVVRPRSCQRGCSNETIPARALTLTTHNGSVKVPGLFAKTTVRFAGGIIFVDGAVGMLLAEVSSQGVDFALVSNPGISGGHEQRCRGPVPACCSSVLESPSRPYRSLPA